MAAVTNTSTNGAGDALKWPSKGEKQHPPGYSIPEKYKSRLEEVEVLDDRSDDEILASLKEHVPVTSEKNVWGFWNTGVDSIPGWSKRNVRTPLPNPPSSGLGLRLTWPPTSRSSAGSVCLVHPGQSASSIPTQAHQITSSTSSQPLCSLTLSSVAKCTVFLSALTQPTL